MNDSPADSSAASPSLATAQRLAKAARMRELGTDPYPARSRRSHRNADLQKEYASLAAGETASADVDVGGRVMSIRNSGMFVDIDDGTGKLQLYFDLKHQGETWKAFFETLDIGDIIGVSGTVRRTKRGELTVNATAGTMLTKAIRPLPEKFHGLSDVETRHRKRYLDLIANDSTREGLRARSKIVSAARAFFEQEGYIEVETPMLQPIYGGAIARPFVTHHNALDMDLYLRIAPELYLKRLLVGGLSDRVFEINRNFRNEGISTRHNPEFTMLEAYEAFADYKRMMSLVEGLIAFCCRAARAATTITFDGRAIELQGPYRHLSMVGEVSKVLGEDLRQADDAKARALIGRRLGRELKPATKWGEAIEEAFGELVEGALIAPTHIVDFPADISPLAKPSVEDPRIAERFETFCLGMEVANAFSEMNDPVAQRKILQAQVDAARAEGEDRVLDSDFLEALEHGMPPAGGLGVGIDRLVMILTEKASIREVIAFPTMRPREA
jgi:lysyl-tRNA synthetase class 2